jgi:Fe-Mn family superoxide dismutase
MTNPAQPHAEQAHYPFSLPNLPYASDALLPHLSPETFEYHHGKHHQAYVTNLNNLLKEKAELQGKSLEELIALSFGKADMAGIFNNAAQIWNHSFYWHSMKPQGGNKPSGALLAKIEKDFGSFDAFCDAFKAAGATQFGSGWAWLVLGADGALKVTKTANADLPFPNGDYALMTADVWEHAYYIDFRNRRPDYLNVFLSSLVNWQFAEENFERATR